MARELGEQRLAVSGLGGTRAAHHEHRNAFEPVQDVGEVAERRAIAPVQIVDREKQRRFRAEVHGQPVEAVQGGEAPVIGGVVLRRLFREPEDGGRRRGSPGQSSRTDGVVHEMRLEQLSHDAEGEVPLELAAASGEDEQLARRRAPAGLREEPGLADPRGTLDQDQSRVARGRGRDRPVERFQLALALEQAGSADTPLRPRRHWAASYGRFGAVPRGFPAK